MTERIKNIAVSITAMVFILGFALFAWLKPADEFSQSERRGLAQLPDITYKTVMSGSFAESFEKYATDQFPLRDKLRTIKGWVNINIFKCNDNNGVYVADGYAAKAEYPVNEKSVEYAAERFNYIYDKYLKNAGNVPYMAVIPDKGQFTSEITGYPNAEYEELTGILKENTQNFKYIDISQNLQLQDYYRTDTHWRQECIIDVAMALAQAMGADVATEYESHTLDNTFYGVYSGQYALPLAGDELCYLTNDVIDSCSVYDHENGRSIGVYDMEKAVGRDPYEMYLSGSLSLITIENEKSGNDKELIIFRDSFGSALAPLMIEGYSKITLVDIRYIHPDVLEKYIEFENQDVLFMYSTSVLNNSETIK